ncbi:MAG: hypothetical protein SGILL_006908 [Bacillariaceae sp.]
MTAATPAAETAGTKISPPTTIHDDAAPSESCSDDVERLFRLIEDERHLSALKLYHSIQERLNTAENSGKLDASSGTRFTLRASKLQKRQKAKEDKADYSSAREALDKNHEILSDLEVCFMTGCRVDTIHYRQLSFCTVSNITSFLLQDRCRLFEKAKQNLNVDDDWTVAQTLFGITTFYRREPDGSLSIKLEGKISGVPLFDQVAVLREIDLHYKWAPFCSSSLTVEHLDKLDTVGWFMVGLPHFGIMRDGCFRAIGCDSIYEDGSVLLVAQGIKDRPEDGADDKHLDLGSPVSTPTTSTKSSSNNKSSSLVGDAEEKRLFDFISNDPILDTLDIPVPPTRMGSGRMTIRTFQALIHIESPADAITKIVTNIDPNLPLIPQSLIDFLMKRLCGVLLSKMQSAARKVSKDPISNPHAVKMREERDFYQGWLLPKFQGVCKLRGWDMPPVSAFELTEAQADLAAALLEKQRRKDRKTIKHSHTLSEDHLASFLEGHDDRSIDSEPAAVGETVGERGPKVRMLSVNSDDMSELSRDSTASSFLTNNPVSKYLREVEERTQQRKAKELKKSRQKAEDRLKPKELDEESRSRLEELRMARNRRISAKMSTNTSGVTTVRSASISDKPKKSKRSWAVFWTRNGLITRLFVLSILTAALFCLLYYDVAFDHFVALHENESFWMSRGRDAATVAYMGAAATVHFFLCYVLLMYAFSSVQIGAIAGKQAKEFYSQNIHLVLAVVSASMVVLGMAFSCLVITFHWTVWHLHRLAISAQSVVPSVPEIPSAVAVPFNVAYGTASKIFYGSKHLVFDSNFVGHSFLSMLGAFWKVFQTGMAKWSLVVQNSVDVHDGTTMQTPWREEAFIASRALFAYSAIFLLVLLFIFNLSAKNARHSGGKDPEVHASVQEIEESKSSSTKEHHHYQLSSRSASPAFDTIEEEEAVAVTTTPAGDSSRSKNSHVRYRGRNADFSTTM